MSPSHQLDFSSPLQARRWLRLLREDGVMGLTIQPGLDLSASELGFSFQSNRLGFRGPCNQKAPSVVLGTSFAMGFAVDHGKNWYDHVLHPDHWLNLGMPVGLSQLQESLNRLHFGKREFALFLYHPNIWHLALAFHRWKKSGKPIFEYFKWKTGMLECLWLSVQKSIRRKEELNEGMLLEREHDGRIYRMDTDYSRFDADKNREWFQESLALLAGMMEGFDQAVVVRVPIKEQLLAPALCNESLLQTRMNYDQMWEKTCVALQKKGKVECVEAGGFELGDYHPWDSHWNESGNFRMARFLFSILQNRVKPEGLIHPG